MHLMGEERMKRWRVKREAREQKGGRERGRKKDVINLPITLHRGAERYSQSLSKAAAKVRLGSTAGGAQRMSCKHVTTSHFKRKKGEHTFFDKIMGFYF